MLTFSIVELKITNLNVNYLDKKAQNENFEMEFRMVGFRDTLVVK
jgi:hypothetical protein